MFRPRKHNASTRSDADTSSPSDSIDQIRDSTGYKRPRLLHNAIDRPYPIDKNAFFQADRPNSHSRVLTSVTLQNDQWSIATLKPTTNTTRITDFLSKCKQENDLSTISINKTIRSCKRIGSKSSEDNTFYYIFPLKQYLVVWKIVFPSKLQNDCEYQERIYMLTYPNTIQPLDIFHPFVLQNDRTTSSLLLVQPNGQILYWDDFETLTTISQMIEIPLETNERITTDTRNTSVIHNTTIKDERRIDANRSIFCWSNMGKLYQVSVSEGFVFFRLFEENSKSVLKTLTKSVSRLFSTGNCIQNSIQSVCLSEPFLQSENSDSDSNCRILLLYRNGILQCRVFDRFDRLNTTMEMEWEFDLLRFGNFYFTENHSKMLLESIHIPAIPFYQSESFTVMLAFVCSMGEKISKQMRYALFQFEIGSLTHRKFKEPIWSYTFQYAPPIESATDLEQLLAIEIQSISTHSMYAVWTQNNPVHIEAVSVSRSHFVESNSIALETRTDEDVAYNLLLEKRSSTHTRGSVLRVAIDTSPNIPTTHFSVITAAKFDPLPPIDSENPCEMDVKNANVFALDSNANVKEYVKQLENVFFADENVFVRVSEKDVDKAAHAAIAIHFQILNANPSSGVRWSSTSSSVSPSKALASSEMYALTPKLIRYQLEEKSKRVETFTVFLQHQCQAIWNYITRSKELMEHFTSDRAKLHAALALCKFQASMNESQNRVLFSAIKRTVWKRGYDEEELRVSGYNAFDMFYCEVSRIVELFDALLIEISREFHHNALDGHELEKVLTEANSSAICLLQGLTSSSFSSTTIVRNSIITEHIRQALLDQIALSASVFIPTHMQSVKAAPRVHVTPSDIFKLATQIQKLGGFLMDSAACPSDGDAVKKLILNPLIYVATLLGTESTVSFPDESDWKESQANVFRECVKLCEKYLYFEGMIFLFTMENDEKWTDIDTVLCVSNDCSQSFDRIVTYCHEIPTFSSFLYQWIAGKVVNPWIPSTEKDATKLGHEQAKRTHTLLLFLISSPDRCTSELHETLLENDKLQKYAWMTAVSLKDFGQAAALTFEQAKKETVNVSHRKTLCSISKIAMRAEEYDDANLQEIQREVRNWAIALNSTLISVRS